MHRDKLMKMKMEKGAGKTMTQLSSDYEIDLLIDKISAMLDYNRWTEEE